MNGLTPSTGLPYPDRMHSLLSVRVALPLFAKDFLAMSRKSLKMCPFHQNSAVSPVECESVKSHKGVIEVS
jgi:hypothetical protein